MSSQYSPRIQRRFAVMIAIIAMGVAWQFFAEPAKDKLPAIAPHASSGAVPQAPAEGSATSTPLPVVTPGNAQPVARDEAAPLPVIAPQPASPKETKAPSKTSPPVSTKETQDKSASSAAPRAPPATKPVIVANQTIKDLDGKIAYRGDIDLTDTLARIAAGDKLRFRNDGSVFQNRERRLPAKGEGYYREWVHPTPGLDGPGPQRVVTGRSGEIFYTADHYRSFKKLK